MFTHDEDSLPIPHDESATEYIRAGVVTIGIEYRHVNQAVLEQAQKSPPIEVGDIDDTGVSIHVFSRDGLERLRFDCFAEMPHYHYIFPHEARNVVHGFDPVANGDMVEWVLERLKSHLEPMLREAESPDLAREVESSTDVAEALPQVRAAISRALKTGRPDVGIA